MLLVGEVRSGCAGHCAEHLSDDVQGDVACGCGNTGCQVAACGCQADGHCGVQVCTGMEGEVHGGEHCQTPSEGDNTPACVLSVGLLEGHCGAYAGTEQNQDEGTEELGSEDSEGSGGTGCIHESGRAGCKYSSCGSKKRHCCSLKTKRLEGKRTDACLFLCRPPRNAVLGHNAVLKCVAVATKN